MARNRVLQNLIQCGIDSHKTHLEPKEEEWKYATC
nr:MAG TPA: Nuclear receptor-interacting protein 1 repression 2 [Caudoviricetes sp.]